MCFFMREINGLKGEDLPAHFTRVDLLVFVQLHVHGEVGEMAERLVTPVTTEELIAHVPLEVHLEVVWSSEGFVALVALIRL